MKRIILIFLSFMIALSTVNAQKTDSPTIVAGTAKLTGRIISPNNTGKDSIFVNLTVSNPISGEFVKYKALVDPSGRFSIGVDMETDITLAHLNTSLNAEDPLLVKLTGGGVTNIEISYNSGDDIKNIVVTPAMSQNDMTETFKVIREMIEYISDRAPQPLYNKSPDHFLDYAKTNLLERLEIVNNNPLLSKELKEKIGRAHV